MSDNIHIQVVTVNHGTSLFAELMLRSLLRCRHSELSITVMDNASPKDKEMENLSFFADQNNIPITQSGFGLKSNNINSHGEILRNFVLTHTDCSHYLFIDTDVYFMQDDSLEIMLKELEDDPLAFGIMPRCTWDGENDHSLPTGNAWTDESCTMNYSMKWPNGITSPNVECKGILKERLHPFCALIRNTIPFRKTVEHIGLSNAWVFAQEHGLHWDTLGLMTAVMKTHGFHFKMSSTSVFHFFGVSYDKANIENKESQCRKFLSALRKEAADFDQ